MIMRAQVHKGRAASHSRTSGGWADGRRLLVGRCSDGGMRKFCRRWKKHGAGDKKGQIEKWNRRKEEGPVIISPRAEARSPDRAATLEMEGSDDGHTSLFRSKSAGPFHCFFLTCIGLPVFRTCIFPHAGARAELSTP